LKYYENWIIKDSSNCYYHIVIDFDLFCGYPNISDVRAQQANTTTSDGNTFANSSMNAGIACFGVTSADWECIPEAASVDLGMDE
jgi:hypothetical protein